MKIASIVHKAKTMPVFASTKRCSQPLIYDVDVAWTMSEDGLFTHTAIDDLKGTIPTKSKFNALKLKSCRKRQSFLAGWRDNASSSFLRSPGRFSLYIPSSRCFSYILNLPTGTREEMQQMASFELRRMLPFDVENISFDWVVLEQTENTSRIWLIVLQESVISDTLNALSLAPTGLACIDTSASFLYDQLPLQDSFENTLWIGVLHNSIDMLLVCDGKLWAHRSLPRYSQEASFILSETAQFLRYLKKEDLPEPKGINIVLVGGEEEILETLPSALPEYNSRTEVLDYRSILAPSLTPPRMDLRPVSYRKQEQFRGRLRNWLMFIFLLFGTLGLLLGINDVLYRKETQYVDFIHESTIALGPQTDTLVEMMDRILDSQKARHARNSILSILERIAAHAPAGVSIDYLSLDSTTQRLRIGGQTDTRGKLFQFLGRLSEEPKIRSLRPVAMPLVSMDGAEVIDYQLELTFKPGA